MRHYIVDRFGVYQRAISTIAELDAAVEDLDTFFHPESILNKNGPLTSEEYEIVKRHVSIGESLLRDIDIMGDISIGVKHHHERVDGKGYAGGLRGDEIPMTAKIINVCNALDRMLTDQPFRKAFSIERAQSELVSNAGTQFDERITAILISLICGGAIPIDSSSQDAEDGF